MLTQIVDALRPSLPARYSGMCRSIQLARFSIRLAAKSEWLSGSSTVVSGHPRLPDCCIGQLGFGGSDAGGPSSADVRRLCPPARTFPRVEAVVPFGPFHGNLILCTSATRVAPVRIARSTTKCGSPVSQIPETQTRAETLGDFTGRDGNVVSRMIEGLWPGASNCGAPSKKAIESALTRIAVRKLGQMLGQAFRVEILSLTNKPLT